MSFPSGLKFRGRRAEHEGIAYFDCSRSGHAPNQRRIKRSFETRKDREIYITRHDAKYHDELLASTLGIQQGPALGDTVADFMQHIERLHRDGKRHEETVRYYRDICKKLILHFGYHTPLDQIGRAAGLVYVQARKSAGSSSQGVRFVKELKVVKRLQRFAGLTVVWETPVDDISPVHRQKQAIPLEDIRAFLRAMTSGSVEHVFAMTKLITMLRNAELYAANVGDLTFKDDGGLVGELGYRLRNKRTGASEMRATFIPHELALLLQAFTTGRGASEPLFSLEGRRLTAWSLRKRFLRASQKATETRMAALADDQLGPRATGASRPGEGRADLNRVTHQTSASEPESNRPAPIMITSIGQFRAEGSSIAQDELQATYPVSEQLGHKSESTTRRHYKLRRKDAAMRQSRRVTETVESKLIH